MKNVVNRSQLGDPRNLLMLVQCLKRDFELSLQNERCEIKSEQGHAEDDIRNDFSVVHLLEEHFNSPAHSS